jgi:membrane protein CcdC involved in cytochrome C biogenesis
MDSFDWQHPPPSLYAAASLAGAAVVLAWRYRETSSPVTLRSLVAPPLGMATGLCMFVAPPMRVPWSWALGAFASGALLFALPLMHSSRLTREGEHVMMRRSPAFLVLLLGLVAVRFALRAVIERYVSTPQTGALFFLLALGAIVRWRIGLVLGYRRLLATRP